MAKTVAYYLDERNIDWVKGKAEQDKRSASDWLNIFLERARQQDTPERVQPDRREQEGEK